MATPMEYYKCPLFNCANAIDSFICHQCANFETHKLVDLQWHIKANHAVLKCSEKLHECRKCTFHTYSKYLIVRHKKFNVCTRHSKVKLRTVPKNVESFQSSKKQSKSLSNNNFEKRYKCIYCPYSSSVGCNLKSHILHKHTHPDRIQWFECEHCSYKGKTNRYLKRHIFLKHNCDANNANLKCGHCPYQTKIKQTLDIHVLMKHFDPTKNRWFECDQCSYKSKDKSDLKKHTSENHGYKETLKCNRCQFKTKVQQRLQNHVFEKHSNPTKT